MSSSYSLTLPQHSLLKKGLTFIPSYQPRRDDKTQLLSDLQDFHRRVMLATYFEGKKGSQPIPFIPKSNWLPHISQLPTPIHKIIAADTFAYKTLNWHTPETPNLTPLELQALKQLKNNPNIVIKPADKGSAVVIWDRKDYIWEAMRQLNNPDYYTKLDLPVYPESISSIHQIVADLWKNKFINYKQRTYLTGPENPRPRRFYLLPKIHKDPKLWSIPFKIPPGRPIVSDCNSESYRIAEYIDHFLQPISIKHPSYLKDSFDFIQKILNHQTSKHSFLFTMDIDNLYTNIETKSGLLAIREWFKRHPSKGRPDEHILQLLEISLTKNDFEFDSEFYLQIKGTAMGKKFAPAYANIYLAHWEESALASTPIKPKLYFRFLDDIWGTWEDTEQSFQSFTADLNRHHPSIKVKSSLDYNSVNFLDTITFKGPEFDLTGKLDVKVFFKETDTHALLHRQSFHPKHTFGGIVKSQLLRFSRICTRQEDFKEATRTLFSALRKRGYPRPFLRRIYKTFRVSQERENQEILPLITTFSSVSRNFTSKIKTNFLNLITNSSLLKKTKLISAYRRNKNLKDLLVCSKLKSKKLIKNVKCCPEFAPKRWVSNKKTKRVFQIKTIPQPHTKNSIYLLYCLKCPAQYIGETRNSLADRLTQHRYNVRHKKEGHTKVVQHFIKHGWQALRITGLQHNPQWTTGQRKKAETWWISALGTRYPFGLNEIT